MSIPEVHELIKTAPAQLMLGQSVEGVFLSGKGRSVVDAVEKVLALHKESRALDLSARDRNALRKQLLAAARRLQDVTDWDLEHDQDVRRRHARRNLALFGDIAEELGLDAQQLQALGV